MQQQSHLEVKVEDASLVRTSNWASDGGLPVVIAAVKRFGLDTLPGVLNETLEVVAESLVPQRAGLGVSGEQLRHLEDALPAEGAVDEGGELGEPVADVDERLEQRPPPPGPGGPE